MEKAGSNPAFDARTVEVPRRGSPRATAQIFRKEACVAVTDADIARSPAYPSIVDVRRRSAPAHWQAVVKMTVTSYETTARKGNSIACSPPTPSMIRGEDRCYFVSKTRGRGFESRPACQ